MSDFLKRNKPEWEELEALVARARRQIGRMTPAELARLDVLYRRTTVHLAQVGTRTRDMPLIEYLNHLTAAAHSVIYLPPANSLSSLLTRTSRFVTEGFARSVARTWRYHAASAVLVLGGAVVAYFAASGDTLAAYALSMPGDNRLPGSTPEHLRSVLTSGREQGSGSKFLFASFLFAHNLKVGLLSLCFGVLAGVPTIYLLVYNGMLLGAFTALHHRAGIYTDYWAWILPHGVTEISAIVLCGGVGLLLGKSVLSPGDLTRTESLRRAGNEAVPVCLGVAGMLVLAAIIESFLRQSHLSSEDRLIFAAVSAAAWIAYLARGVVIERGARRRAMVKEYSTDAAQ
jgi:uncharacterized membrane protein SpoIIM required for sporulation